MIKSIYEEAKRDLISLTAKFVIPSVEETDYGCIYDSCHFYNILDEQEEGYLKNVEQTLEQAQKQEKLLVFYKDLAEVRKEIHDLIVVLKKPKDERLKILFTQEAVISSYIRRLEK